MFGTSANDKVVISGGKFTGTVSDSVTYAEDVVLVDGVARVDNSALKDTVDKYEAEGLSKGDYTAESWAAYEMAMTTAKSILNNVDATKEAIEAAKADLDKAYNGLTYATPSIIAGANSTWQLGSEKGLTITSDAAYKNFVKVTMDGKDVDKANYTVAQGSTIVTLNAAYLNTLAEGTHEVAIVSTTGTATTKLTIAKASSAVTTPQNKPNTTTPSTTTETTADKEETVDTGVFNATSIMTMWALVGLGFAVTITLKKKVNG